MVSGTSPQGEDARVHRLIDDISRQREAREEILSLGERAVDPLDRYLVSFPQSIPHARMFAVQLLGALAGEEATKALRRVLYRYDLKKIDPVLAQSEYVVKNAAVEQLLTRGSALLTEDLLYALRIDRLPAAVRAVARLRITAALPDLIQALEDDVLSVHAVIALREFGHLAVPALAETLTEQHRASSAGGESRISRRRRILAAMTLAEIGAAGELQALAEMTRDAHPAVAAAAAWALWRLDPARLAPEHIRLLIHGCLSPEAEVRERCRQAVRALGSHGVAAALGALGLSTTVDLYGVPVEISESERLWLLVLILERFEDELSRLEQTLAPYGSGLLIGALRSVQDRKAVKNIAVLARHPDEQVRDAAAQTLGRLGGADAASVLVALLEDRSRAVRAAATRSLREIGRDAVDVIRAELVRRPPLKALALRLRLWWLNHRLVADVEKR